MKKQYINEIYEIEKVAFSESPSIIFSPEEFEEQFRDDTISTALYDNKVQNPWKAYAFIIFNYVHSYKELYEFVDKEDLFEFEHNQREQYSKLLDALTDKQVLYLDDVASLEKGGLTIMIKVLQNRLTKYILFHGRMLGKSNEKIIKALSKVDYNIIYHTIVRRHFGNEDFEFVIMEK